VASTTDEGDAMTADARPTVYPVLSYRDAAAALDWLQKAFGFEQLFATPGEDGTIVHAELSAGNGVIMLGSGAGPNASADWRSVPQSVYVAVEDTDAHYARARAAGAEITREPEDLDYGSREYSARDLEGHHWHFGTYRPGPKAA
jgi:uncharacterized glyoxalase superfamily protein PhnB